MKKKIVLTLFFSAMFIVANAQVQLEWAITPNMWYSDSIGIYKYYVNYNGNIYVTGCYGNGTRKGITSISPDGQEIWEHIDYQVSEVPSDVIADSNYVYIVSTSYDTTYNRNVILSKYDNNGNVVWNSLYNSPVNGHDEARGIKIKNQNIYVLGTTSYFASSIFLKTCLLIKYDVLTGDTLWSGLYYEDSCNYSGGRLLLDSAENIYVIGSGQCAAHPHSDYQTYKFDSSGQLKWFNTYNGPATYSCATPTPDYDVSKNFGLDNSGYVYVAGSSNDCGGAGPGTDFATLKYRPTDGAQVWLRRYNGPSNSLDDCNDMVLDKQNGAIYETGRIKKDYIEQAGLIKYDLQGNFQWERFPMNNVQSVARTIALDDSGYVYIAGGDYLNQAFIFKFDTAGNIVWQQFHAMPTGYMWYQLSVDKNYNVFVTIFTQLAKYCQQGSEASFSADNDSVPPNYSIAFANASINAVHWLWDFGDSSTDTVNYNAAHAYASAGLYTVKLKTWNACGADSTTITVNVDSTFVGIEEENIFSSLSIQPNPATNQLTISSGQWAIELVEIYDVVGEKCLTPTLSKGEGVTASIDVSKLSPGIYFVQVRDEKNNVAVRKFVKM